MGRTTDRRTTEESRPSRATENNQRRAAMVKRCFATMGCAVVRLVEWKGTALDLAGFDQREAAYSNGRFESITPSEAP